MKHYSPTTNTWFYNVLYCLVLQQISQQHIVNEQTILQHTQKPINHNKKKHSKYKNHRAWMFAVRQVLYLFWLHPPKDQSNPELLTFNHTDCFQGKYTAQQNRQMLPSSHYNQCHVSEMGAVILKCSWLDRTDKRESPVENPENITSCRTIWHWCNVTQLASYLYFSVFKHYS